MHPGRLFARLVSALWNRAENGIVPGLEGTTSTSTGELSPAETMKTIRSLHAKGEGRAQIEEISQRFLASRGEDRVNWTARILAVTDRKDEAEQFLRDSLAKDPESRATRIALAEFALDTLEWIRYEEHIRHLQQLQAAPEALHERVSSILRCLEFLRHDTTGKAVDALKIPDSVYEYLLAAKPLERYEPVRNKVVLAGATMGAGGAERVLAVAYQGLKASGKHDINLWLYTVEESLGNDFYLHEMHIDRQECVVLDGDDVIPEPFNWLPFHHARRAYNLYLKILEEKPEILHGWQDGVNLDVLVAGALAGVRNIVLHTHNMQPDKVHRMRITDSLKRIYAAGMRRPNTHLVCVSSAALEDYLNWLSLKRADNHHVIYNGFRLGQTAPARRGELRNQYRQEYGIPAQKFVVGSAFRFDPVKRPLLWFAVAQSLIEKIPEVHFLIFGTGELRQTLIDLISQRGLAEYFSLPGVVSKVPDKLCLLDVLLLTSASEGLPTVVIEAQHVGVPVVAPCVGGIAECVVEGQTALLLRDDEVASYVAAVLEIRNSRRYTFDPTGEAGDFLRDRFSEDGMIFSIENIYAQFD